MDFNSKILKIVYMFLAYLVDYTTTKNYTVYAKSLK